MVNLQSPVISTGKLPMFPIIIFITSLPVEIKMQFPLVISDFHFHNYSEVNSSLLFYIFLVEEELETGLVSNSN